MQNIYTDTRTLDRAALERFCLTDDILMENAAGALEAEVVRALQKCGRQGTEYRVLIVTGSGDNGGDGWALARRLNGRTVAGIPCRPVVLQVLPPKSEACKRQAERARRAGVHIVGDFQNADIHTGNDADVIADIIVDIVGDCLFGSGFHGSLDADAAKLIEALNKTDCFKIACDIPSGIDSMGCGTTAFCADITVTMGALKTSLFSDFAKNHTGKIITSPLGVSSALFENGAEPAAFLLEGVDLHLPERNRMSVHKGDFGHAAVYAGDKAGAGVIASCAAFRCGAGLVSLIHPEGRPLAGICFESGIHSKTADEYSDENSGQDENNGREGLPFYVMQTERLPEKATVIVAGPGFGRNDVKRAEQVFAALEANFELNAVLDADMFYYEGIKKLLEVRSDGRSANLILTPHPKEFQSLLALCDLADVSVRDIAENRLELVRTFCSKYPGAVLLLKGANMVIGYCPEKDGTKKAENRDEKTAVYINSLGMPCLAKGGSGDVLAGFIAGLFAQKYSPLDAAIQGSLLLAASSRLQATSYSSTPFTLIQSLEKPEELKRALEG